MDLDALVLETLKTAAEMGYDTRLLAYVRSKLIVSVREISVPDINSLYFGRSILPTDRDHLDGVVEYKIEVYTPTSEHWFVREFRNLAFQSFMDHELIGWVYADLSETERADDQIASAHKIRFAKHRARVDDRWVALSKHVGRVMQEHIGARDEEMINTYRSVCKGK